LVILFLFIISNENGAYKLKDAPIIFLLPPVKGGSQASIEFAPQSN